MRFCRDDPSFVIESLISRGGGAQKESLLSQSGALGTGPISVPWEPLSIAQNERITVCMSAGGPVVSVHSMV